MEVYQSDKNNAKMMFILMQSIIDIAFMKDETRDDRWIYVWRVAALVEIWSVL